jgi:hypothetical protein
VSDRTDRLADRVAQVAARAINRERTEMVEFARVVQAMRQAQRAYFQTRGQGELLAARDLERRVDDVLAGILRPPLSYTRG